MFCGELYFTTRIAERTAQKKDRIENAGGRGGISFGCDKADMHVTLRSFIQ